MGFVWLQRHTRMGYHSRHRIYLSIRRASPSDWRHGGHSQRQPRRFWGAAGNVQSSLPHGLLLWPRRHQPPRPLESLRSWSPYHFAAHAIAHLSISTAYGHFFVGRFMTRASPPGKPVDYAAVWATYKF